MVKSGETKTTIHEPPLPSSAVGRLALRLFRGEEYQKRLLAARVAEFKEVHKAEIATELANQTETLSRINILLGANGQQPDSHYDFRASFARSRVTAPRPDGSQVEVYWEEGERSTRKNRLATVGVVVRNRASAEQAARLRQGKPGRPSETEPPYTEFYRLRYATYSTPSDSMRGVLRRDFGKLISENGRYVTNGKPAVQGYDYQYAAPVNAGEVLTVLQDNWTILATTAGLEEADYAGPTANTMLAETNSLDDLTARRDQALAPQGQNLKKYYF